MKFIKTILKKIYDPEQKVGEFGEKGSKITGETNPESGNGYQANQNIPYEVNTGTDKPIDTGYGVESDIHDFHVDAVQTMLGNPKTVRPAKNTFRDVDRTLATQYFNNLERR